MFRLHINNTTGKNPHYSMILLLQTLSMASRMRLMRKCMRLLEWLTAMVLSLHSPMDTIPTLAKPHWLSLVDKSNGLRLQGKDDFVSFDTYF